MHLAVLVSTGKHTCRSVLSFTQSAWADTFSRNQSWYLKPWVLQGLVYYTHSEQNIVRLSFPDHPARSEAYGILPRCERHSTICLQSSTLSVWQRCLLTIVVVTGRSLTYWQRTIHWHIDRGLWITACAQTSAFIKCSMLWTMLGEFIILRIFWESRACARSVMYMYLSDTVTTMSRTSCVLPAWATRHHLSPNCLQSSRTLLALNQRLVLPMWWRYWRFSTAHLCHVLKMKSQVIAD